MSFEIRKRLKFVFERLVEVSIIKTKKAEQAEEKVV